MTDKYPVVGFEVMKRLFPEHKKEAHDLVESGLWFYSVPDEGFVSYIPNVNVCVNDVPPLQRDFSAEEVNFTLRRYGSVYEVTVENNFPSSFFLASNFTELVQEHLDVTPDLYATVFQNVSAPIILGSWKSLSRLLFTEDASRHKTASVDFFKTRKVG